MRYHQVVGNAGVVLAAEAREDLSGATGGEFLVRKPDGTQVTWPGTLTPPGTPRDPWVLSYTTAAGDLDQPGEYVVQPVITGPGMRIAGQPVVLLVHEELEVWG